MLVSGTPAMGDWITRKHVESEEVRFLHAVNRINLRIAKTSRRTRRDIALLIAGSVLAFVSTGCGSWQTLRPGGWSESYGAAEARVRETDRELLICYRTGKAEGNRGVDEMLNADVLRRRTKVYVRCRLYSSHEPDRRYVAQYGVDRAPALIVVHRDGTYHAMGAPSSAAEVVEFLDSAGTNGMKPTANPHIPRAVDYDWRKDYEAAVQSARQEGRPVFVVVTKALTRPWRSLRDLLERREVYGRVAEMIHCRLSTLFPSGRALVRDLGISQLPALVIVHTDGTSHVLEAPTSYEQVVRFADRHALSAGTATAAGSATAARAVSVGAQ